jgi:hypothetical protein
MSIYYARNMCCRDVAEAEQLTLMFPLIYAPFVNHSQPTVHKTTLSNTFPYTYINVAVGICRFCFASPAVRYGYL